MVPLQVMGAHCTATRCNQISYLSDFRFAQTLQKQLAEGFSLSAVSPNWQTNLEVKAEHLGFTRAMLAYTTGGSHVSVAR